MSNTDNAPGDAPGAKKSRRTQFEVMIDAAEKLPADQKIQLRDALQASLDAEAKQLEEKLKYISSHNKN